MPIIKFEKGWDESDDNHNSNTTEDQMRQLVVNIRNIYGMGDNQIAEMPNAFKLLAAALAGADQTIWVVKGIHYAEGFTHFTIRLVQSYWDEVMHVYVNEGKIEEFLTAGKTGVVQLYNYKPVGLSTKFNSIVQKWPASFTAMTMKSHQQRARSGSVNPTNVRTIVGNSTVVDQSVGKKIDAGGWPSLS